MKKRIDDITHPSRRAAAIRRLFNIMLDNGYPEKVLNRLLYQAPRQPPSVIDLINQEPIVVQSEVTTTSPQHPIEDPLNSVDNPLRPNIQGPQPRTGETIVVSQDATPARRYAVLPFIQGLTHKLIALFSKGNSDLKIAQYNLLTNKKLFTTNKDPVPLEHRHDVVYKIPCKDCNLSYIGQTSQTIKQRMTLHKSDVRLKNARCALTSHVSKTGHNMLFDGVKVLDNQKNLSKRLFLEMCYINNNENLINNRSDIDGLSSIYSFLLSLDKYKGLLHDVSETLIIDHRE